MDVQGKHSEKKAIARKDRVNRIGIPVIIGVNVCASIAAELTLFIMFVWHAGAIRPPPIFCDRRDINIPLCCIGSHNGVLLYCPWRHCTGSVQQH